MKIGFNLFVQFKIKVQFGLDKFTKNHTINYGGYNHTGSQTKNERLE